MKKRIMQVTASALLFTSLAGPAFAQGEGRHGGRGFGHQRSREAKQKHFERFDRKAEKWAEKWGVGDDVQANSACVEDARLEHMAEMESARNAYQSATKPAQETLQNQLRQNMSAMIGARRAALNVFKSSSKTQADWDKYVAAVKKANDAWHAADEAARERFRTDTKSAHDRFETAKKAAREEFKGDMSDCGEEGNR